MLSLYSLETTCHRDISLTATTTEPVHDTLVLILKKKSEGSGETAHAYFYG